MLTFSRQPPTLVYYGLIERDAPLPLLIGITEDETLCRVHFVGKKSVHTLLKQWQREWPATEFIHKQRDVTTWWKTTMSRAELPPILLVGTPFQCSVWGSLLTIPNGETITYGELAHRIGKPKAARAVGSALGKNPVPLLVPCHRVVGANNLGGFTGGLRVKEQLLNHEGAKVIR